MDPDPKDPNMTDTILEPVAAPLDPKRPWITDPADLPSELNWFSTLLNPFGQASKVHFTRAWTALFFARVLPLVITLFVSTIVGISGGDASGVMSFGMTLAGFAFVLSLLMSFVLHMRRLADADKPVLYAGVVFAPVFAALLVFLSMAVSNGEKHDGLVAQYEIDAADPAAAEARFIAEQLAEGVEADKIHFKLREPGEKMSFVMSQSTTPAGMVWALVALALMLWSLLWVARQPKADVIRAGQRDYELS